MSPNPSSLINMATNSDRNLSYEQMQAMWPDRATSANIGCMSKPYEPFLPTPNTVVRDYTKVVGTQGMEYGPPSVTISEALAGTLKVATKHDAGKLDWSLLPYDSIEEIVKVLEFGKNKYAAWNWSSNGGFKYTRVFNATMRHLLAWIRGEDKDPETGLSHIAHAGCNILFLMHFIKNKNKFATNDDRQNG